MANGIWMVSEWYLNVFFYDILYSVYRSVVLNGILNYRWEYHWVLLKYHWMVQWYSMVFNGIQWYSMVYHWHFFVRGCLYTEKPCRTLHVVLCVIAAGLTFEPSCWKCSLRLDALRHKFTPMHSSQVTDQFPVDLSIMTALRYNRVLIFIG